MSQQHQSIMILSVLGLILASLVGCQLWDRHERTPTTPGAESSELANYAQMHDGSTVVDGQQINWVVSEWGSLPYGYWMYVEVNQQDAVGHPPGEHQVPVTLGDVVLSFSDLPDAVTQILIGVKVVHDDTDDTFTEIARFAVVAGSVSIPLAYADLVSYFGVTHYSIWFQVLGGDNDEGIACGHIALSGVMPGGQGVNLSKRVCVGTHPASTPSPASTTRFIDNTDGTVTDTDTGLTWQRNANAFGWLLWDDGIGGTPAPDACANLADGTYGLTDGSSAGDWRLPGPSELRGLYDAGIQYGGGPTTPFTNVQSIYWGTDTGLPPGFAWIVYFDYGNVSLDVKGLDYYVWCVRG